MGSLTAGGRCDGAGPGREDIRALLAVAYDATRSTRDLDAAQVMNLGEIIAGLRATGAEFEDVEAKRAAGGLPGSLASTLAAFANARGAYARSVMVTSG